MATQLLQSASIFLQSADITYDIPLIAARLDYERNLLEMCRSTTRPMNAKLQANTVVGPLYNDHIIVKDCDVN